MAGFDVGAQRAGLAARLATVTNLRVSTVVPDDVVPPMAIVAPGDPFIDYHLAMGNGLAEADWRIIVAVSKTPGAGTQDLLDDYLSSGTGHTLSIIDAIEADKTLGGAVQHLHVGQPRAYGTIQLNEQVSFIGFELPVVTRTSRQ